MLVGVDESKGTFHNGSEGIIRDIKGTQKQI